MDFGEALLSFVVIVIAVVVGMWIYDYARAKAWAVGDKDAKSSDLLKNLFCYYTETKGRFQRTLCRRPSGVKADCFFDRYD